MTTEYVGAVILEVDGKEVDVVSVDVKVSTGRKLVKTMNKTGRAKGFSQGIAEYSLSVTVAIPKTGELNWEAIVGAKLTLEPAEAGGQRTSYLDCFATEVGEKYTVDNEAVRDIQLQALRKVVE